MTEMVSNNDKHDIDQVWKTVNALQDGQSKSQTEIAGLVARMSGVESKLDSLASMLTTYITKPQKDFNWFGLFSILISSAVVAGMLVTANLGPIREKTNENREMLMARLMQLKDDYRDFGIVTAKMESQELLIMDLKDRMHDVEQSTAACETDRELIHKQLDAVDFGGSRKWIGETKAP
jgi:hypothetical protein